MISSKRGAALICTAGFLLTLLYLAQSSHRPTWHSLSQTAQVVGLGDLLSDENETSYENPRFKSSRIGSEPIGIGIEGGGSGISSLFKPGIAKPPGSNYTRALVIARTKEEDVDWIYDPKLDEVEKRVYVVDDRHANLTVPRNKGHEVMVYLTYIIDHYHDLPDVSMFMHAHEYAWHQNDLLNNDAKEMVMRLSNERIMREGYMNLRCHWMPGCPDWMHPGNVEPDINKEEETVIAQAWAEIFPERDIPSVLGQPCCAQFALSKQRIHVRSLKTYKDYRDWLLSTPFEDKISGRIWEYLWQVVFTDQAVFCPNQWSCYCDGYGVCFENEAKFDYWFELRWRRHELEEELSDWNEQADKVEAFKKQGRLWGIKLSEIEVPEMPEAGRNLEIEKAMADLDRIMEEGRMDAIVRGTNPSFRAWSSGRPWVPGDGY